MANRKSTSRKSKKIVKELIIDKFAQDPKRLRHVAPPFIPEQRVQFNERTDYNQLRKQFIDHHLNNNSEISAQVSHPIDKSPLIIPSFSSQVIMNSSDQISPIVDRLPLPPFASQFTQPNQNNTMIDLSSLFSQPVENDSQYNLQSQRNLDNLFASLNQPMGTQMAHFAQHSQPSATISRPPDEIMPEHEEINLRSPTVLRPLPEDIISEPESNLRIDSPIQHISSSIVTASSNEISIQSTNVTTDCVINCGSETDDDENIEHCIDIPVTNPPNATEDQLHNPQNSESDECVNEVIEHSFGTPVTSLSIPTQEVLHDHIQVNPHPTDDMGYDSFDEQSIIRKRSKKSKGSNKSNKRKSKDPIPGSSSGSTSITSKAKVASFVAQQELRQDNNLIKAPKFIAGVSGVKTRSKNVSLEPGISPRTRNSTNNLEEDNNEENPDGPRYHIVLETADFTEYTVLALVDYLELDENHPDRNGRTPGNYYVVVFAETGRNLPSNHSNACKRGLVHYIPVKDCDFVGLVEEYDEYCDEALELCNDVQHYRQLHYENQMKILEESKNKGAGGRPSNIMPKMFQRDLAYSIVDLLPEYSPMNQLFQIVKATRDNYEKAGKVISGRFWSSEGDLIFINSILSQWKSSGRIAPNRVFFPRLIGTNTLRTKSLKCKEAGVYNRAKLSYAVNEIRILLKNVNIVVGIYSFYVQKCNRDTPFHTCVMIIDKTIDANNLYIYDPQMPTTTTAPEQFEVLHRALSTHSLLLAFGRQTHSADCVYRSALMSALIMGGLDWHNYLSFKTPEEWKFNKVKI